MPDSQKVENDFGVSRYIAQCFLKELGVNVEPKRGGKRKKKTDKVTEGDEIIVAVEKEESNDSVDADDEVQFETLVIEHNSTDCNMLVTTAKQFLEQEITDNNRFRPSFCNSLPNVCQPLHLSLAGTRGVRTSNRPQMPYERDKTFTKRS